jgi:hypothetical protein
MDNGRLSIKGKNDIKSIFNTIKNDLTEYFTNPDYIFHEKAFDENSPCASIIDIGEGTAY